MYKRAARVLFLEAGDGTRARCAQALAPRGGGGWLMAATATVDGGRPDTRLAPLAARRGVGVDLRPCPLLCPERVSGCDLVVLLEREEGEVSRGEIQRPLKAWPLQGSAQPATVADLERLADHLEARLRGMAGGLRMLARAGGG